MAPNDLDMSHPRNNNGRQAQNKMNLEIQPISTTTTIKSVMLRKIIPTWKIFNNNFKPYAMNMQMTFFQKRTFRFLIYSIDCGVTDSKSTCFGYVSHVTHFGIRFSPDL